MYDAECVCELTLIRLFLQSHRFVLFGNLNKSKMCQEKTNDLTKFILNYYYKNLF